MEYFTSSITDDDYEPDDSSPTLTNGNSNNNHEWGDDDHTNDLDNGVKVNSFDNDLDGDLENKYRVKVNRFDDDLDKDDKINDNDEIDIEALLNRPRLFYTGFRRNKPLESGRLIYMF